MRKTSLLKCLFVLIAVTLIGGCILQQQAPRRRDSMRLSYRGASIPNSAFFSIAKDTAINIAKNSMIELILLFIFAIIFFRFKPDPILSRAEHMRQVSKDDDISRHSVRLHDEIEHEEWYLDDLGTK
ncbi:MAG: hypothetical protein GY858_03345 [Candidatus Omnitrophica bacterium]|nr:hypothetical protein [Candidatus Omnitrophota bacterium]